MKIKGISRIYIINLDRCKDRLDRMYHRLFNLYNLDKDYVERISAFDENDSRILSVKKREDSLNYLRTLACALSHEEVWNRVHARQEGPVLILEDDILFHRDWITKTEEFLANPPNTHFELFMLNASGFVDSSHGVRLIEHQKLLLGGAYIITLNAVQKLLWNYRLGQENKTIREVMSTPADYRLVWLQCFGKSYFYFPWLSMQEHVDSEIEATKEQTCIKHTKKWYEDNYYIHYKQLYDFS